ncbi:S-layer homology domain-containing protein [Bacillus benzoevorans]|uniref:SLH domain-containing protein n=1 Tax=Bacillus benzoevorans TaxID=1456 RepID=A0A7X0HP34_9BACI|nr:S-layer homology domain-containing protein [Bacillus benzoevorans]MBB6444353.1 hypothetical protein [Bacillus benzoevorans]
MRAIFKIVIFSLLFCLAVPITGLAAGKFGDVSMGYTFYEEIEFLASKQIISGYEKGMFKPYDPVTRAEAAIMIGRALELNGEAKNTKFRDVTAQVTGSGYIAAAVEKGIISGYSDGTYRPHDRVSRAEMAILLNKAFRLEATTLANPFIDISANMASYQSILNAYASGIATGFSDGTYRPEVIVTRGQFSAFLARSVEPSFRGNPAFAIESISGWNPETSAAEVDIDHTWDIKFNDEVDFHYKNLENIYIVRESDNKKIEAWPTVDNNDFKTVKVRLYGLFDFDETYYLVIDKDVNSKIGNPLTESFKIKFHTRKPEFTTMTSEQDGLKYEIILDQTEKRVYTKLKVSNTSNKAITVYGGGCERSGISAYLAAETETGLTKIGSQWKAAVQCPADVFEFTFKPGATLEDKKLLYFPAQPVNGDINLIVRLQNETHQTKFKLSKEK